jgi:hypothetical protein
MFLGAHSLHGTPSPPPMSGRNMVLLFLGVVMMCLGGYVALRPMFVRGVTITGKVWLDAAFALVFLLRGWMNVKRALRKPESTAR